MVQADDIPNIGKPHPDANTAEKVAMFPENADHQGRRFDVYLGEEAKVAITLLMQQHHLSAPRVIDTLVRGAANMPLLELNKWFVKK